MRAFARLLSIPIALAVLGCNDATGPDRVQRTISSIQVPASAASGDTIRIKFQVDAGCDGGVIVASQLMTDRIQFSASSQPSSGPCTASLDVIPRTYLFVVAPFHSIPFTVSFAEPGQADNVFVVIAP